MKTPLILSIPDAASTEGFKHWRTFLGTVFIKIRRIGVAPNLVPVGCLRVLYASVNGAVEGAISSFEARELSLARTFPLRREVREVSVEIRGSKHRPPYGTAV